MSAADGEGRTGRAIALVQKVVSVTVERAASAVARRHGDGDSRRALGTRTAVRGLHLTTLLARQLARAPFPAATATQRFALTAMANELRRAASGILAGEASHDRATVEGALAEVIEATLALVDAALRKDAELTTRDDAIQVEALPEASGEGDAGGSR
jgi:hypothetical protein